MLPPMPRAGFLFFAMTRVKNRLRALVLHEDAEQFNEGGVGEHKVTDFMG
jgi:hypothetical protein